MEKYEIGVEHLEALSEMTANKLSEGINPKFAVGAIDALLGRDKLANAISLSYQKCGLDTLCSMHLADYMVEKEFNKRA